MSNSSSSRRPIDKEIEALADAGLLYDTLITRKNGRDDLSKAYALACDAVDDQAFKWGTWYERQRQHQREVALTHKKLSKKCQRIGCELSSFIVRQGWSLIRYPVARPSVYSIIRGATELGARFEGLSLAYGHSSKINKKDGHPSDRWLLGFVWGMAVAWRQ